MPEYDAFGREIGEDPLASLRNPAPPPADPMARPEPVRDPVEAPPEAVSPEPGGDAFGTPPAEAVSPPPDLVAWSGARGPDAAQGDEPPRIEFVRPRRRRGGLAGLLVLVTVLGGLGLAANAVVEKGSDIIDEISVPDAISPSQPQQHAQATGLQTGSWLREENFANALTTLQAADLGKPVQIRIAPDRINATLIKGDRLHIVQIKDDGELTELASNTGSGTTIPFNAIDPAAPEKLVRRGADRKHPVPMIDYVLVNPGPPPNVAAYFRGNRIVIGDRHGRPQRVI